MVRRIQQILPQLEADLPASIHVTTMTDMTTSIQSSVNDVEFELMLTIGLVVMVIFLFLRSLSATIIPSVAVPLSLVGTFAVMYLLGFTLDNLSLMALTISTGFVVDDAIVMIENISRYLEEGMPPLQAALTGAGQIGFTIVSLTVSLIAVLIPLLFMGDVVGRLFREFAVTLAVTIVISAVVSLTLTPMMCARILRHDPEPEADPLLPLVREHVQQHDRLLRPHSEGRPALPDPHSARRAGHPGAHRRPLHLHSQGLLPGAGYRRHPGHLARPTQSISFTDMAEQQQELARIILQDPAVESLSSFIGADGINTTLNSGRISINLKPLDERHISASDVIRRLQQSLPQVPGIHLYMQPVQDITVDDRVSRTQYQYTLEDPDTDELNSVDRQVRGPAQEDARARRRRHRPADRRSRRPAR